MITPRNFLIDKDSQKEMDHHTPTRPVSNMEGIISEKSTANPSLIAVHLVSVPIGYVTDPHALQSPGQSCEKTLGDQKTLSEACKDGKPRHWTKIERMVQSHTVALHQLQDLEEKGNTPRGDKS